MEKRATGATITSKNGNKYNVTYDETNNKIELAIDTKGTPTSIKAYDGSTVSGDTIELQCEVTQEAETDGKTSHYLTNIA